MNFGFLTTTQNYNISILATNCIEEEGKPNYARVKVFPLINNINFSLMGKRFPKVGGGRTLVGLDNS